MQPHLSQYWKIPPDGDAAFVAAMEDVPQVAAIGGSWMAGRKLVSEKNWAKITALTSEGMKVISQTTVSYENPY